MGDTHSPPISGISPRRFRASASPSGARGWSVEPIYCRFKFPGVMLCRSKSNSMAFPLLSFSTDHEAPSFFTPETPASVFTL